MGLAICKRIVETTGGEIWIADSPVGCDVRFTVPTSDDRGADGVAIRA